MSKEAKLIRGQVRQVVAEILTEEMSKAITAEVLKAVSERLSHVEKNVRETLALLDKRSKDVSGYLVRQASAPAPQVTDNKKQG